MTARGTPKIRIGWTSFEGLEALRSQRWAIMSLILAKTLFWLSLTALLWLGTLKPELLHVIYRANDRVECSGLLCPLLKIPLLDRLVAAGPLHFQKVWSADMHHDNIADVLWGVLGHGAEALPRGVKDGGVVIAVEEVLAGGKVVANG